MIRDLKELQMVHMLRAKVEEMDQNDFYSIGFEELTDDKMMKIVGKV